MCEYAAEEDTTCLGLFPVDSGQPENNQTRIPFSGFKKIEILQHNGLFSGIESGTEFYFSENYFLPQNKFTTSIVENGGRFSASMERDNAFGVQFHPERSGKAGEILLKNFMSL
jgi:glutamine amidotransferase